MSSSLFNDLSLSTAQINSDYRLAKLNEAGLQLDALNPAVTTLEGRVDTLDASVEAIQGGDANNNILVGDNITNVPDVDNMVIIGDGDKVNAKAKDVLLGDGVVCDGADIAGTFHLGQGMSAAVADDARASTHYIPIYYNGTFYRLPVSTEAAA
jgi:hypothetical protein